MAPSLQASQARTLPARSRSAAGVGEPAIVHVAEAFGGGVLETIRDLANYSAAAGIQTTVIYGVRPETPDAPEALFDRRVRLVRVHGWGRRDLRSGLASGVRAGRLIRRELANQPGGVVHFHSSLAGLVGRLLPPVGPAWSIFYSPQAYAFQNPAFSARRRAVALALEALLARRGRIVAVSQSEAVIARRLSGRTRVKLVRRGIPLSSSPPARTSGELTVMAVGRAVPQRRPEDFATVAREVKRDVDAVFRWIGDGPGRELLEEAGVAVEGWLPHDQACAAFAESDIVLHLTAFEGLPGALLEAMAAGRAVVASDIPPIREVLEGAGLLVGSAAAAASAVRVLANDADLRGALGARARERVETTYTAERMAQQMLKIYGIG